MSGVDLYTIGFTKKKAKYFFGMLKNAGVKRVLDVRLNNVSQLAGFAKKDDLIYFLQQLGGMDYVHLADLAPTQEMLDAYKKQKGDWAVYESRFLDLMAERRIENSLDKDMLDGGCLLCSEDKPHHCHRRLVAEYLQKKWGNEVRVTHLV
ncbi:MAG: DUF488 domain-containing protein [Gammaproteobacteria bacterium]|nr:DUF488 domain-containing protein [Gammaproteobacteria bacterium]MDA7972482.1 DUF488 domain-containing protein [Gammaproteobacteria bacterium]MDA8024716.1 DUF488 domain-containing protein [Gammaproteobacteria bacterium]MDA8030987.1 DUF488 domain-containing protein [Alphaproteobacteria bacterium]